jgi:hypothetical protein
LDKGEKIRDFVEKREIWEKSEIWYI